VLLFGGYIWLIDGKRVSSLELCDALLIGSIPAINIGHIDFYKDASAILGLFFKFVHIISISEIAVILLKKLNSSDISQTL
jgi:hypothetical protein